MEKSMLTEIFLPLALGVIMLGMGLSLTLQDFKRFTVFPKAVFVGLLAQIILLPLLAFGLMSVWEIKPEFAVGIVLLAAIPGGPTSNLLAYMGKCDAALSITLTAVSSFITIITIPFIVNYAMETFMGAGQFVKLDVIQTMLQILVITIIPVSLGMFLNKKFPATAIRFQRLVKIASAVFITIIILGAVLNDRENLVPYMMETGAPALVLNVLTMLMGFGFAKLLGLNFKQASTISMETGIQNGTLAIAIATSATLLNNPTIAVVPALYSLIMFATGGLAAYIFAKVNSKMEE
jgi:BASS family bile acid:Na+ symporter